MLPTYYSSYKNTLVTVVVSRSTCLNYILHKISLWQSWFGVTEDCNQELREWSVSASVKEKRRKGKWDDNTSKFRTEEVGDIQGHGDEEPLSRENRTGWVGLHRPCIGIPSVHIECHRQQARY